MDKKVYAASGATNNPRILRGYRVTSGRRMVVNSGMAGLN